jgi:hypothetical protein
MMFMMMMMMMFVGVVPKVAIIVLQSDFAHSK